MRVVDVVVIGAGAAGLMCAAAAGQRGRSVLVIDHANKAGKKILMSGGGRCNFTNTFVEPANFLSGNPHFCKSALSRYTQYDFIALVERHGLAYHEKALGQLFCDHKSRDILDILLLECADAGVDVQTSSAVVSVERSSDPTGFELVTGQGKVRCESLVVATGGLSIPTMGATGFGYDLAKQFGLRVTPRHAALVPFTLKGELLALAQSLAGVSLPVSVRCREQSFSEALLFTHKGLSGPAILQISNYWYPGDAIEVDFLPGQALVDQLQRWRDVGSKAEVKTLLSRLMPARFVQAWLDYLVPELANRSPAELTRADMNALAQAFHHWQTEPTGTEGYRTAEVTRGGVHTDDLSSKTFEAKATPGLYFIGEVLDVTGWLGGYNFQWAWASGWCAGQVV